MRYDTIIIGSGPGGYVAAIRSAQLGMKTAVIERTEIGGICLNWGCIPTKALLKSAKVFNYAKHTEDFGVKLTGEVVIDFDATIQRSRGVSEQMSKGVDYLLKKNKVEIIKGFAKVAPGKQVEVVSDDGAKTVYSADNIIIATGARSRQMASIPQDGKKIIGYRKALTLDKLPESMLVVGSGAIGSEFAYFYSSLGTKVTLVEYMPTILPLEDEDVSKQMARSFKKAGIKVMTSSSVEHVDTTGEQCVVTVKGKKKEVEITCDIVFSAVGVTTNIEGIGLEEVGIATEDGKVVVDEYYHTNVPGYYAVGDIVKGQALAHVASHEAIICVEKIAGKEPHALDYNNIPACTYTYPEVASVGITERVALEKELNIKVGKYPFTASGKATAAGVREGFIKVIFDADSNLCLGAHMVGENVTEMISEIVVARKMKATGHDLITAVHPHPTLSEAVMEAVAEAYGECVHL